MQIYAKLDIDVTRIKFIETTDKKGLVTCFKYY